MSKVNITMPQEVTTPVETVQETVSCIGLIQVQNRIPTKLSQLENDIGFSTGGSSGITYVLQLVGNLLSLVGSDGSISSVLLPTGAGPAQVIVSDDGYGNIFVSGVSVTDDGYGNVLADGFSVPQV